jgi:hypothetical protein
MTAINEWRVWPQRQIFENVVTLLRRDGTARIRVYHANPGFVKVEHLRDVITIAQAFVAAVAPDLNVNIEMQTVAPPSTLTGNSRHLVGVLILTLHKRRRRHHRRIDQPPFDDTLPHAS